MFTKTTLDNFNGKYKREKCAFRLTRFWHGQENFLNTQFSCFWISSVCSEDDNKYNFVQDIL